MKRPLLLDLFCGAGGCAVGYYRAGFDVIGVDIEVQPHYPFEFHQANALDWLWNLNKHWRFAAIHASPPCQAFSKATAWRGNRLNHPRLIYEVRQGFEKAGKPWVIENVPLSQINATWILCGTMFGLPIRRHRSFETSGFGFKLTEPCQHRKSDYSFDHGGKQTERTYSDAMGCEWMTVQEARQAISPAYTEFIGRQLMEVLQ